MGDKKEKTKKSKKEEDNFRNIAKRAINVQNEVKDIYKTYNNLPLIVNNIYKVRDLWYVYVGDFSHKNEVPATPCCYTIGDGFYIRHYVPDTSKVNPNPNKRKRVDDDVLINTEIKDTDNTLMILIKTTLAYKKITRGMFKEFYTNVSDMNNVLRCITNDENLSWARFTDLCDKLNVEYDLVVRDNDGSKIIET